MKLTDLVLVFIIITAPFGLMLYTEYQSIEQTMQQKIEMDHILDTATEDGASLLIENGDGYKIRLNKEACVSAFYNTMYVNFNIISDQFAQAKLRGYIPVIVIVDYDGFYALTCQSYKDQDHFTQIKPDWQPKKTFTYREGNYIYGFTVDDYLTVYNIETGEILEGKQKDLKEIIKEPLLQDNQVFDAVRRRTIIEALQNEINQSINKHNEIARQFGINYQFTMPVIEEDDWYRTVNSIGMLAFFQGMPTGIEGAYYNQFAFGGAQLYKGEGYYIQVDSENGLTYYHRSDCNRLTLKNLRFTSPEACAIEGAFPCNICKP